MREVTARQTDLFDRSAAKGPSALYKEPMKSRRSGPLYNAFSYPTKIDPEAVALYIAAHTEPGQTVLDVFAGSGTTGIGARLCANPTARMREQAEAMGLEVKWGPRNAVLYEISVLGSLLTNTMCDPPDPVEFAAAAAEVINRAERQYRWIYEAEDPEGGTGTLRYAIWSDVLICPTCGVEAPFWDVAASRKPASIQKQYTCASCGNVASTKDAPRADANIRDPLTGEPTTQRVRRLAQVYGESNGRTWQREPCIADERLVERVAEEPIPEAIPIKQMKWGDLHRNGYHRGIDYVHQFYTRRNLFALGSLWSAVEEAPTHLRDPLRLLVLSYNASHSTLMTRVVAKKNRDDFVLSGAQSGVLYISSLPVEKNVFAGVRRKIKTFRRAYQAARRGTGAVEVVNGSSTELHLPDNSVDYVFTDPPFGDFIPYSEINQINEAWLDHRTDHKLEAIISPAQGKDVGDYGALMSSIFSEVSRVLKPTAEGTVIFHSSRPDVWAALGDALSNAGLVVQETSLLDKTQVSFKQVVSSGSTRGDAVFRVAMGRHQSEDVGRKVDLPETISRLKAEFGEDTTPQHLYSRYVAQCVGKGQPVRVSARAFYAATETVSRLQP